MPSLSSHTCVFSILHALVLSGRVAVDPDAATEPPSPGCGDFCKAWKAIQFTPCPLPSLGAHDPRTHPDTLTPAVPFIPMSPPRCAFPNSLYPQPRSFAPTRQAVSSTSSAVSHPRPLGSRTLPLPPHRIMHSHSKILFMSPHLADPSHGPEACNVLKHVCGRLSL